MEKGSGTVKKVFTVIGNVIIWLFVIFATLITVFTIAVKSSKAGIPSIGSNVILTVSSDSMAPTFERGDIILGKKLPDAEKNLLKVDDVITFDAGDLDGDGNNDYNTHRIVEIVKDDKGNASTYKTKGDNNPAEDEASVQPVDVVSKWTGKRIKGVGKALNFLQTRAGFMICVVLPLILLFVFELIRFIQKYMELKGGKATLSAEEEERIRQQAVAEYLASKGDASAPAQETPVQEAPVAEESAEEAVAEEAAEEAAPAQDAADEAEEPAQEAAEEPESADEKPADE